MAHRKRGGGGETPEREARRQGFPPWSRRLIGGGGALLALGFVILTWTDPYGRNWASVLSPALILGGYAVIFAGLAFPEGSGAGNAFRAPEGKQRRD